MQNWNHIRIWMNHVHIRIRKLSVFEFEYRWIISNPFVPNEGRGRRFLEEIQRKIYLHMINLLQEKEVCVCVCVCVYFKSWVEDQLPNILSNLWVYYRGFLHFVNFEYYNFLHRSNMLLPLYQRQVLSMYLYITAWKFRLIP